MKATEKTHAVADGAVISSVSTRRDVGGGFIVRSNVPKRPDNKRFLEELIKKGRRMCECVLHSRAGCVRTAVRRIMDDEGNWHYYCGECLPNHFRWVCGCPCRGCLDDPASLSTPGAFAKRRRFGTPPTDPKPPALA